MDHAARGGETTGDESIITCENTHALHTHNCATARTDERCVRGLVEIVPIRYFKLFSRVCTTGSVRYSPARARITYTQHTPIYYTSRTVVCTTYMPSTVSARGYLSSAMACRQLAISTSHSHVGGRKAVRKKGSETKALLRYPLYGKTKSKSTTAPDSRVMFSPR